MFDGKLDYQIIILFLTIIIILFHRWHEKLFSVAGMYL